MRSAAFSTDITERKQAEEALRQQTERKRLVEMMTQRLRQSLNLQEILNTTVAEVTSFSPATGCLSTALSQTGVGLQLSNL